MALAQPSVQAAPSGRSGRPQVVVVTTAMLVFISFWRAAAIVLCDMASTAYYIGGIVEQAIGKAAPWYIGAVMLFAYAVRGVYIESCAMFVRGGVYRVVKEAMGGTLAKLSVSALMFDYVLTGPISGVSAGQYIVGLAQRAADGAARAVHAAAGRRRPRPSPSRITLYFWHQNILGIEESSDKAMKIMGVTTVMVVVMIGLVRPDHLDARRDAAAVRRCTSATTRSAGWRARSWAKQHRRVRHRDRLRPLDPGDERRGVAGAGESRDRLPEGEEPDPRRLRHLPLQHAHDRR